MGKVEQSSGGQSAKHPSKSDRKNQNKRSHNQQKGELELKIRVYRQLFRNLPDITLFFFDADFRYILAEGTPLIRQGIEPESLIGKRLNEVLDEREYKILEPYYQNTIQGKESVFERERGGRYYLNQFTPLKDDQGEVLGGVIVSRDTTSSKFSIAELQESEFRMMQLFDNVQLLVVNLDTDGIITYCNRYFAERTGFKKSETIGKNMFDFLIVPEFKDKAKDLFQKAIDKLHSSFKVEGNIQVKKGQKLLIDWNVTLVRDRNGHPVSMSCIGNDKTQKDILERALRDYQQTLEKVFSSMEDALFVVDAKTRNIANANAAVKKIFGYKISEVIGRNTRFLHLDDEAYKEFGRMLSEGLEKEGIFRGEFKLRKKDGTIFDSEHTISQMMDPKGERMGLVSLVRDVTDRKKSEDKLNEAYRQFELILDSIEAIVYVCDFKSYEILFANRYVKQKFGNVTGKTCWKSLQSGQTGPCEFCGSHNLLDSEGNPTGIHRWEFKNTVDGHWYDIMDQAIRWIDGRYVRMEIAFDIDERKSMEQSLVQAREELERFFDLSLDMLCIAGVDGYFKKVNQGFVHTLGYTKEELLATPLMQLIHPDDRKPTQKQIEEQLQNQPTLYFENRYRTKKGEYRWLAWNAFAVMEEGLLYGIARDITEMKKAQKLLERSKQEAEKANMTKSAFLAAMSHEIRTPLTGIIGTVNLIKDSGLTNDQKQYIRAIEESGENLLNVVNDILDFSKMGAGKLKIEREPFHINQLLEDLAASFRSSIVKTGVDLDFYISPEVPAVIVGDKGRIGQVLINLVGNAFKFTEKGEISIEVEPAGYHDDRLVLGFKVTDTGIGIDESLFGDIFVPYNQSRKMSLDHKEGTGLGLSISRTLVELMDGRIWVKSKLDQGSTFCFTVATNSYERDDPHADEADKKTLKGLKALVVEENRTRRNRIKGYLEQWGMKVLTVGDPVPLENTLQNNPDLDIVLWELAVGEEMETMVEKLSQKREVKLIKIGFLPVDSKIDLHSTHQQGLIKKPIAREDLHQTLIEEVGKHLPNQNHQKVEGSPASGGRLTNRFPYKILVAEDNRINLMIALKILEVLGYEAESVTNGKMVLEKLEKQKFDLIFMDIQMPEMGGLETTAKIIEKYGAENKPVIIAMTANVFEEEKKRYLSSGMDDFIAKPFYPEIIEGMLIKWGQKVFGAD